MINIVKGFNVVSGISSAVFLVSLVGSSQASADLISQETAHSLSYLKPRTGESFADQKRKICDNIFYAAGDLNVGSITQDTFQTKLQDLSKIGIEINGNNSDVKRIAKKCGFNRSLTKEIRQAYRRMGPWQ